MAYAGPYEVSNIGKTNPPFSPRSTAIQEPIPETRTPPTLSEDENLVLSLRLRDGVPNPVPHHRRNGVCKYEKLYAPGDCEWCQALDRREDAEKPDEPNPSVLVMSLRFLQTEHAPAALRRIA